MGFDKSLTEQLIYRGDCSLKDDKNKCDFIVKRSMIVTSLVNDWIVKTI